MKLTLDYDNGIFKRMYFLMLLFNIAILGIATYQSFNKVQMSRQWDLETIVLLIGTFIYICLLFRIKHWMNYRLFTEHGDILAIIICVMYFVVLLVAANLFVVIPQYDLNNLQREACLMLEKDFSLFGGKDAFSGSFYFSECSAQIPVTILLYWVYKIFYLLGIENYVFAGSLFNCLCIALTALACYFLVKMESNIQNALLVLLVFILNPIFYIYASYSYTDTLSMPWAMWGAYCFLQGMQTKKDAKKRIVCVFGGFLLLLTGMTIRATAGILLIALIGYALFEKWGKRKVLLLLIVPAFLLLSVIKENTFNYYGFNIDHNAEFPVTHWVMMGTNEEKSGWYSGDDVAYTRFFSSYDDKVEGNLEVIQNRLKQMGIDGTCRLMLKKIGTIWSAGDNMSTTFASMRNQGAFYRYTVGSSSIFYRYVLQINRCGLLLMMLLATIKALFKKNRIFSPWSITFFGAVIFYLLWEVHNRYSLSFVPWMVIFIPEGIACIDEFVFLLRKVKTMSEKHIMMLWEIVGIALVFVTILLYASNWEKYVIMESTYEDKIIFQRNRDYGTIDDIGLSEIKQTFVTGNKYNQVELYFVNNKVVSNKKYRFQLLAENGDIIYSDIFSYDDIESDGNIRFEFRSIYPKGRTQYTIGISVVEPEGEHSIGVYAATYIDMLPDGIMLIDGEEQKKDMQMIVYNVTERTYTSKNIFLVLIIMTFLLELMCFIPGFKRGK